MLSRHVVRLMFAIVLSAVAAARLSAAATMDVTLVFDPQQAAHRELLQAVRDALTSLKANGITVHAVSQADFSPHKARGARLLVPVGTAATASVADIRPSLPVLSVLIPRPSFEEIRRRRDATAAFSAIYVDQPIERRLDLVRLALPNVRRLGVAFGPSTIAYREEIERAAQRRGLELETTVVSAEERLYAELGAVLARSDAMLAVVDPLVFSRTSTQTVLLTAYRRRVPLIGVSPAYVHAGAVVAVYSTPAQIGRQLAETLIEIAANPARLPPPAFPRYFSVAVNHQVAESFGLYVDDDESLQHRLSGGRAP